MEAGQRDNDLYQKAPAPSTLPPPARAGGDAGRRLELDAARPGAVHFDERVAGRHGASGLLAASGFSQQLGGARGGVNVYLLLSLEFS